MKLTAKVAGNGWWKMNLPIWMAFFFRDYVRFRECNSWKMKMDASWKKKELPLEIIIFKCFFKGSMYIIYSRSWVFQGNPPECHPPSKNSQYLFETISPSTFVSNLPLIYDIWHSLTISESSLEVNHHDTKWWFPLDDHRPKSLKAMWNSLPLTYSSTFARKFN